MAQTVASRRGARAEAAAESFLVDRGLFVLARNHHCRQGEIDLIVRDGEEIVFVEVRARRAGGLVDPLASVTVAKQRRIVRAAQDYLMRSGLEARPCRFDVVSVVPRGRALPPEIVHVENAFDASVIDDG